VTVGKLDGKIALITGGSSGMALATAEKFIAEGARVTITGRREEALDAALERLGPQAKAIVADSSNLDDIDRLFTDIERLDILFASAGIGIRGTLLDVTPEHFDEVFNLNVRGTLFTAQKAAARMNEGGSIILNGSVAAMMADPGVSVYAASKAALVAFARAWSVELAGRGIRVNVVHPGLIDTAVAEHLSPDRRSRRIAMPKFGRIGVPREIADAVLFLAADDSSYVTGTELVVSGGMELAYLRD
jgi:NAD(P)-dependent dehydrogenase (short-subunit alcohol dehydrogenase family)